MYSEKTSVYAKKKSFYTHIRLVSDDLIKLDLNGKAFFTFRSHDMKSQWKKK